MFRRLTRSRVHRRILHPYSVLGKGALRSCDLANVPVYSYFVIHQRTGLRLLQLSGDLWQVPRISKTTLCPRLITTSSNYLPPPSAPRDPGSSRLALMQWIHNRRLSSLLAVNKRSFGIRNINSLGLRQVPLLPSWDPEPFQAKAYLPALPYKFARSRSHQPPACSKWFIHQNAPSNVSDTDIDDGIESLSGSSELKSSLWTNYQDTMVPLELTSTNDTSNSPGEETFQRIEEAPLRILLAYLSPSSLSSSSSSSSSSSHPTKTNPSQGQPRSHSIYLAQCSLTALPPSLQEDIPTPNLIARPSSSSPIKGDIYASSLWLGRPPTYTPLHRDPNPNIFIQLAGHKTVRLLPPEIGAAVFADVQARLHHRQTTSAAIRGEEMMAGPEKAILHAAIWPTPGELTRYAELLTTHAQETTLGMGDALFIPKGWWHSVKGVGAGVTASANWWFR